MPVQPGARLGAYEIVAPLGAGGMGEVYRARDTKLGREVAIKVLPDSFVNDPERVARFEREAQLLAALNHPHIAAIYGLERSADTQFLVLELVDGETLAAKLEGRSGKGLRLDEALGIARQIADAVQAAHDKGIVHRDLKPANIALTHDGAVKVLDFGLARQDLGPAASSRLTPSPTLTFAHTQAGVILGTAAYMSPEQAKGRVADKRSDIWAFGCVLYEMLSGTRAFEGEDVSETLAAILRAEPDWARLPEDLQSPIRTLIERCLKKDRQQRIADIAVAQFLLDEPFTTWSRAETSTASAGSSRPLKMLAAALALTTIGAAAAAAYLSRSAPAKDVTRFLVTPPDRVVLVTALRTGSSALISPDGRRLAFTARDESGKILIWLRSLDALVSQPLAGTDDAEFPFWSPDSRSLAYFAHDKLLRIDTGGGPSQTVCDAPGARGGAWSREGVIVFGGGAGKGLERVMAAGGAPVAFTTSAFGNHRFPSFLPDGRHVLFVISGIGTPEKTGLYISAIDSPQPRRLASADSGAVYAAPGFLLFARQTTLLAQPFDLKALDLTGDPTPIAERVESGVFGGVLAFSVSDTGTLAYGLGSGRDQSLQLMWFDRQGKALQAIGPPAIYLGIDLSPDEKQIVVHRHDQGVGGDLWLTDLGRGTTSRFTFDATQDNSSPVWSPDGSRIVYASLRNGRWGLYVKPSNGSAGEESLTTPSPLVGPRSWSRDGHVLVYAASDRQTANDVWMLPLVGERKAVPLLNSRFQERFAQISPDGRWLAYSSDENGTSELYVRPFPSGDGKWQISTAGGWEPRWRGDSRELFYADSLQLGSMMAVDINGASAALSFGNPRKLFDMTARSVVHPGAEGYMRYAVSHDGQRLLIPTNSRAATFADSSSSPIAVVVNWVAALKK